MGPERHSRTGGRMPSCGAPKAALPTCRSCECARPPTAASTDAGCCRDGAPRRAPRATAWASYRASRSRRGGRAPAHADAPCPPASEAAPSRPRAATLQTLQRC
eukprot:scaffold62995_cov60-Phaeocystis_antarctica.AAC.1